MFPSRPAIIGAIADSETARRFPKLDGTAACDWLEWRADAVPLPERWPGTILDQLLLTVRHPAEGGLGDLNTEARRAIFLDHLPAAHAIDLEIRSLEELADVAEAARKEEVAVLASYHDFQGTPDFAHLTAQIQRGRDLGADAVKIVTRVETSEELFRLVRLLEEHAGTIPLAVMGMGPLGMISRLLLAQRGSIFNYAYLEKPNAPGQWPATKLRQLFQDLGIG